MKSISNTENSGLKTVSRALKLLEWIGGVQGQDPTVREAAEALGLNITTCYHVVNTLAAAGYLMRGPDRGLRLGPQVAVLYQAFHQSLQPARELLALLQDLGRKVRETVYLSTWDRGNVILQAVVEAPEALRVAGLYVGLRGAMHCRAGGKAILAYLSSDEVDAFIRENSLKAHTPMTRGDLIASYAGGVRSRPGG
jgi:IclR family acetate operon transcriptional repressor